MADETLDALVLEDVAETEDQQNKGRTERRHAGPAGWSAGQNRLTEVEETQQTDQCTFSKI